MYQTQQPDLREIAIQAGLIPGPPCYHSGLNNYFAELRKHPCLTRHPNKWFSLEEKCFLLAEHWVQEGQFYVFLKTLITHPDYRKQGYATKMLNIVKDTSGNTVVAQAVQDVHDSVKEGETIVAPLEASRVFPPMVISMVDVGEKTGDMPQMLEKIADTYDEEVDRAVESMTSLIEPVMIVFLAVIVGSIVIAMFLPLIKMIESIS